VLLDSGRVVGHVQILVRPHKNQLVEPLQPRLFGKLVQKCFSEVRTILHRHLLNRRALLHGVDEPQTGIDEGGGRVEEAQVRAGKSNQRVEVLLVLLEPGEGRPNDESSHRVRQEAYLWNVDILAQLVVDLSRQPRPHFLNVALGPRLVRSRNVHLHPEVIVPPQLRLDLFHVEPTRSQSVHHDHEDLARRCGLFGPLNSCPFLEEDGPFDREEAVVEDGEDVGFLGLEVSEVGLVLVPELVGQLVPHLLLVAVHVDLGVALEPDHRLSHPLPDVLHVLVAPGLEVLLALLLEEHSHDFPPNLIYLLRVFVEELLIQGHLFPLQLLGRRVEYFPPSLFLADTGVCFRVVLISFCFLVFGGRGKQPLPFPFLSHYRQRNHLESLRGLLFLNFFNLPDLLRLFHSLSLPDLLHFFGVLLLPVEFFGEDAGDFGLLSGELVVIFGDEVEGVVPFSAEVVGYLVDVPLAVALGVGSEVDGAILVREELVLIDAAVNSANDLAGSALIKVQLEVGVEGALADAADALRHDFALVVVDVDQLCDQLGVADVLAGLVEGTVQLEDDYFAELDLSGRRGTFMPAFRKNILEV
jgi:hypothetical protein